MKLERSLEKITENNLAKILKLAKTDIDLFFQRNPKYIHSYEGKEVLVALGQGAALHYINKKNGVKDFDVWFFYPRFERQLPYRRRGIVDYGKSKFGVHPNDKGFKGKRIDVLVFIYFPFLLVMNISDNSNINPLNTPCILTVKIVAFHIIISFC